jgi:hypothetical protein
VERTRADGALGLLLAGAFCALYLLTPQERLNGDAVQLVELHAFYGTLVYHHVLTLPVHRLFEVVLSPDDPLAAQRIASSVLAACAVGLSFVLARQLGARRGAAALGAALLGVTPAFWFFATTIEVHALHACAVALAAVLTLALPWERPARALPLALLVFPLLYLTHRSSVLLGPGWVLLVGYAAARRGAWPGWPRLVAWGAAFAAVLALLMVGTNRWLFGEWALRADAETAFVAGIRGTESASTMLIAGWLLPMLPLLALSLPALLRRLHPPLLAAAEVLMIALPLAFFLAWGVDERGGYFLGTACFLAALTAAFAQRVGARLGRAAPAVAALLLALAAVQARTFIGAFDRGWSPTVRAELAAEVLPDGGVLLAGHAAAPLVTIWHRDIREHELLGPLTEAAAAGEDPGPIAEASTKELAELRKRSAVAFDLSNPSLYDRPALAGDLAPYLEAMAAAAEATLSTRRVERDGWVLLVVEPPADR